MPVIAVASVSNPVGITLTATVCTPSESRISVEAGEEAGEAVTPAERRCWRRHLRAPPPGSSCLTRPFLHSPAPLLLLSSSGSLALLSKGRRKTG